MTLCASDLMETAIVTIPAEMPLLDVQRLLDREGIRGAPVLAEGRVVGVIAAADLVRAVRAERDARADTERQVARWADGADDPAAPLSIPPSAGGLEALTAADAMATDVVAVAPSASVAEIARVMRERGVQRVLVVDDGGLRGVVTTTDLVALLERA